MNQAAYRTLARVEDLHWWYLGMRATALSLLLRTGDPGELLDAGCGTGGWLAALARARPEAPAAVAVDLYRDALLWAGRRGVRQRCQATVTALPLKSESFDSVSSLDVVYHQAVGSDLAALREFHRILRPGGRLLIQVPAYDWLRGRHDDEVGTRERYNAHLLADRLRQAGFEVERLTYANGLLLGAAILWRFAERFTPAGPARDLTIPPEPINRLAIAVLDVERRWIAAGHRLFFGLSVIATARRSPSSSVA